MYSSPMMPAVEWSRSPYGERGLKFGDLAPEKAGEVALLTESVD